MRPIDDPLWGKIVYIDSKKLQELLANIEPLDFVPVVRCKDCKHWDTDWSDRYDENTHYCIMIDGKTESDFYCADGERKEE